MRDGTVRLLSRFHRDLYRATRGLIGKRLPRVGAPMLLLTTVGRVSGRRHTVPLLYLAEDDGYVVIASYGGRDRHPAWYLNLQQTPDAEIQVEARRLSVRATDAGPGDRARLWDRAVAAYPGYTEYEDRTDRVIPVVLLEPAFQTG